MGMKCAESNDGSSDKRDAEHPDSTLEVAHCPEMTVRFHHVIFIRPAKQGLAVNRKIRPNPESRCARCDQQKCRDIKGGARTAPSGSSFASKDRKAMTDSGRLMVDRARPKPKSKPLASGASGSSEPTSRRFRLSRSNA